MKTKFSNFKNKSECEKDKKQLLEESKIITSCRDIVYVDNPPTNILVSDEDDEERIIYNKKTRERSRIILLNHLEKVCVKGVLPEEYFKLKMWDELHAEIANYKSEDSENLQDTIEEKVKSNNELQSLIILGKAGLFSIL